MPNSRPLTNDDLVRILFGSSAFQMLNAGCRLGLSRCSTGNPAAAAPPSRRCRDGSWTIMEDLVADLTGVRRVLDVGGDGVNSSALAAANLHVEFTVLNLPEVADIARCKIAEHGLSERISVHDGDIFADRYPAGHDCVLFANQLVIWSPEENLRLLEKAFAAAPRRWTAADIQRDLR